MRRSAEMIAQGVTARAKPRHISIKRIPAVAVISVLGAGCRRFHGLFLVLQCQSVNTVVDTRPQYAKNTAMDRVFCADVWFATAEEQRVIALKKGVAAADIHKEGEGAEGWASMIMSFRGRPGRLGLVGGLYIIAQTSDELKKRLMILRSEKIKPFNLETGEEDGAALYAEAMSSIMGSKKFRGDRKKHRKISARGGEGKAKSAKVKRDGIAEEWLIRNIVKAEFLTWEQREALLTKPGEKRPTISEASLRRHYL